MRILDIGKVVFSLGFVWFLDIHSFNGGGITGVAQIIVELTKLGSVGMWTLAFNIPLFIIGGLFIKLLEWSGKMKV